MPSQGRDRQFLFAPLHLPYLFCAIKALFFPKPPFPPHCLYSAPEPQYEGPMLACSMCIFMMCSLARSHRHICMFFIRHFAGGGAKLSPTHTQSGPPWRVIRNGGFLSAAQPTDQGEESVVLLVVVGAGTIFHLLMYSFLGCEEEKLCPKRGVKRQKLCRKRGVERQKLFSQRGVKRQRLYMSWCLDLTKILYSTPQISKKDHFLVFVCQILTR